MTRWKNGHESVLASGAPVAPSYVGQASIPDYDALQDAAITRLNGGKSFAGQAEDRFFLDVGVFDLLYGGDLSGSATTRSPASG